MHDHTWWLAPRFGVSLTRTNLLRGILMTDASAPVRRPLAIAAAVVFLISSLFPLVAGFVRNTESWPKWWGVLDVSIAFVLAILAFAIMAVAHGNVDKRGEDFSYRAYRVLIHGI